MICKNEEAKLTILFTTIQLSVINVFAKDDYCAIQYPCKVKQQPLNWLKQYIIALPLLHHNNTTFDRSVNSTSVITLAQQKDLA